MFYALFSTISMLPFFQCLKYFLVKNKAVLTKPVYTGIGHKTVWTDYMYFQISSLTKDNSIQVALLFVVLMVITTFLLKKLIQLFGITSYYAPQERCFKV
jgi:subfamily B ATP-binding cassette protein MsbA